MSTDELNAFINVIKSKENYIAHGVLNRGLETLIVYTKIGWFIFHNKHWNKITSSQAQHSCNANYQGYTFSLMLKGQS